MNLIIMIVTLISFFTTVIGRKFIVKKIKFMDIKDEEKASIKLALNLMELVVDIQTIAILLFLIFQ